MSIIYIQHVVYNVPLGGPKRTRSMAWTEIFCLCIPFFIPNSFFKVDPLVTAILKKIYYGTEINISERKQWCNELQWSFNQNRVFLVLWATTIIQSFIGNIYIKRCLHWTGVRWTLNMIILYWEMNLKFTLDTDTGHLKRVWKRNKSRS